MLYACIITYIIRGIEDAECGHQMDGRDGWMMQLGPKITFGLTSMDAIACLSVPVSLAAFVLPHTSTRTYAQDDPCLGFGTTHPSLHLHLPSPSLISPSLISPSPMAASPRRQR